MEQIRICGCVCREIMWVGVHVSVKVELKELYKCAHVLHGVEVWCVWVCLFWWVQECYSFVVLEDFESLERENERPKGLKK